MIHQGNESNGDSKTCFRVRRALKFAAHALSIALAGLLVAPALAQAGQAASSGGGAKAVPPSSKKVKTSGPAKSPRPPSGHASKSAMMTPSRVIVVFPTDGKGGASDQLSDTITETIQGRIAASGRYQTLYFLRSIPTVQRALNESTLTANEVSHPFDDDTKLRKLMPNTGYDMALTTSIDSYTYDSAKNQVTVLISARLIDYRGDKAVVRAAAENGSSPENSGNVREIVLAAAVAKSITEKLITSLLAQEKPMASTPTAAGK
jgi:hypothetical protein